MIIEAGIKRVEKFFDGEVFSSITKFKAFLAKKREVILEKGAARQKILIACHSLGALEGMKRLLEQNEVNYIVINSFADLKEISPKYIGLCIYELEEGFETEELLVIAESMVIGRQIATAKKRRELNLNKLKISANSFEKGDLVVHKDYGIGLFEGVLTLESMGIKHDSVKIIYQNGDALYVPIYNINQIKKYGSEVLEQEKQGLLDKLGGVAWKGRKAKAKLRIFAIAEKLMKLAAKRSLLKAVTFEAEPKLYEQFESGFPFQLTQDQEMAIADITQDLANEKPMDRLICGDVGFGKTEVAMRAAFIVASQRLVEGLGFGMPVQVAIVCPTTILARQHFNNFTKRFEGTGIVIKELSRNITQTEKARVLKEITSGEVDILIGTHSLFGEKVKFKNLQLLIIDEEQHFGVKQKEKLKEGRENIHFLSLSATPIPRTLQMSLSGLRDISIITTPPFDRILPKTFLMPYDVIVLSSAIIREKARGGRVFFVCPRISDLEEQKQKLEQALPEVKFAIAHGRMGSVQIEDTMLKFYEGFVDVLITTSIIESGIDISFANTIIIYRAEMFGLAQSYQLRGRVGRGSVQSYAYLIVDEAKLVEGSNAKARLQTLTNIKSLGEGFKIAGVDMDIRGAGNLVGEEQAGKMNDVGVELYQEMLEEAVLGLKDHKDLAQEDFTPEIKIGMGMMLPESYIPDFNLRLEFYRRISAVSSLEELEQLNEEMEDRFGALPKDATNLINIINIKIRCKALGILKFEVGLRGALVVVSEKLFQKGEGLLNFTLKNPGSVKINPEGKVMFSDENPNLLQKANRILNLIEKF